MTSESRAKLHTRGLLHMKGLEQALDVSLVQARSCLALLEKKSSDMLTKTNHIQQEEV